MPRTLKGHKPVGVGRAPRIFNLQSQLAYAKFRGMTTLAGKLLKVFRANVKQRLASMGWNQGDLAEEMGVTPSYITQILGRHRGVGLDVLENVANALDVPADELIKIPQTSRKAS